jgi:ferrous iron transport protein A
MAHDELSSRAAPPSRRASLVSLRAGERVRIHRIAQDSEHAAWLRAVGMHEGAEIVVLRFAPFGGPIHLRSSDGGEFAIHRDLARAIEVSVIAGDGLAHVGHGA